MKSLRDVSVGRKLLMSLGVTTGLALLVVVLAVSAGSLLRLQRSAQQQLLALADITGTNSQAALSFDDTRSARDTLSPLLSNPLVETAAIYDRDNHLFASIPARDGRFVFSPTFDADPDKDTITLRDLLSGRAVVARPIVLSGERLGTVMLVASLAPALHGWAADVGLMLAAAGAAFASALLLAFSLRRLITVPLEKLSEAANAVATDQDYSRRVAFRSEDEIGQLVGHFNDMLAQIEHRDREIMELAFYDPLTHLPNRRLLLDRLQQALAASARHRKHGAVMLLDLDGFKGLNDTWGHDVGDLFLSVVARRLEGCVRECDTVARQAGDEFVVILEGLSESDDAVIEAENVGRKILQAITEPYQLEMTPEGVQLRRNYQCTVSIGITLFRGNALSVDELIKRADTAMYQAKASGRNTLRFFDPEMQSRVLARALLDADLREAVRDGQFILHYQPQVDRAGHIFGAEALIRWPHPQRGMVSPADFIPQAEEIGVIQEIGRWVLESACKQLAAWAMRREMAHLTVAVNVSPYQFRNPDFVEQVLAILERTGAQPQKLEFEITESMLLGSVEGIAEKMVALKAKGIGFSLDDFGTGYSSLVYLKRLPLDQLKIDRSFIKDILSDPNDAEIARTITALAHGIGLEVIAEGVETEEQRDVLIHQGCVAFQGYLFGRPMPADEFSELVLRSQVCAIPSAMEVADAP
ncbi:hypothetical protein GCM10027343_30820 [Noviherbaspirillum agri]